MNDCIEAFRCDHTSGFAFGIRQTCQCYLDSVQTASTISNTGNKELNVNQTISFTSNRFSETRERPDESSMIIPRLTSDTSGKNNVNQTLSDVDTSVGGPQSPNNLLIPSSTNAKLRRLDLWAKLNNLVLLYLGELDSNATPRQAYQALLRYIRWSSRC